MSQGKKSNKRYIVDTSSTVVLPSVESLINDALNVIQKEISRYSGQVNRGETLDLSQARVFQGYIKSLTEMARESRESAKQEDMTGLSNDEIIKTLAAGREDEIAQMLLAGKNEAQEES